MVKLKEDFVTSEIDSKSIILNLISGKYYSSNEVGSHIINVISSKNNVTIDELYEILYGKFYCSIDKIIEETDEFINKLLNYELFQKISYIYKNIYIFFFIFLTLFILEHILGFWFSKITKKFLTKLSKNKIIQIF